MTAATLSLAEFLAAGKISKSLFYRDYRWNAAWLERYEIHEDALTGQLRVPRSSVALLAADRKGPLALARSARAARLGAYAQKGAPPPHRRGADWG